jgi:hypothetical protein
MNHQAGTELGNLAELIRIPRNATVLLVLARAARHQNVPASFLSDPAVSLQLWSGPFRDA